LINEDSTVKAIVVTAPVEDVVVEIDEEIWQSIWMNEHVEQ